MLDNDFYDQPALSLARALLGKVIRHRVDGVWLSARIIETEAYEIDEKGSHASLGRTPSREALFEPAGTIYMYYARGGDSLNVSARGAGNAVLIKSAFPYFDRRSPRSTLDLMQRLNPNPDGSTRDVNRLCRGQTLLCKALALRVPDWNGHTFQRRKLFVEDVGYRPEQLIRAPRLGIPEGRDEHLLYRFVDWADAPNATSNPLTKRSWTEGEDYEVISSPRPADQAG